MTYKTFWTRISLLIVLTAGGFFIAYSCGWTEDECDSYVSFVLPQTADQPLARPLYYTPNSQFYGCDLDGTNGTSVDSLSAANSLEWSRYTQGQVSAEAVDTFLYSFSYDTLKAFYDQVERGKAAFLGLLFQRNGMSNWFRQGKDLEALGYLLYAKRCEPVSTAAQNEWDVPVVDSILCRKLIRDGKQLYAAAKGQFIKERYALQLIKTAFYAGQFKTVDSVYQHLYTPVKGSFSSVDTRVMGYRAGALYRSGRKSEAAYAFSRLFDESGDAAQAYSHTLGFVWAYSAERLDEVITHCKNPHEQAMVYALAAMRETEPYSVTALDRVYRLEPDNRYLDVILIREINKMELEFMDYKYAVQRGYHIYSAYYGDANSPLDQDDLTAWMDQLNPARVNLKKMADYIEKIAAENKVSNKALWLSAAGYVHLMLDEQAEAGRLLQQAEQSHPNPKVATQIRILMLLHAVQNQEKITPAAEANLLTELAWMEGFSKQNKNYHKLFKNLLRTALPLKYAAQGDSLRMLYCYARYEQEPNYNWEQSEEEESKPDHFADLYYRNSGVLMDRYFTQAQLEAMKELTQGKRTPFEQWLLKGNPYTVPVIRELQAVKYFRTFQYEQARQVLAGNQNLPVVPDLFVAHIRDYQEGYEADSQHSYTTLEVLDTLLALKQRSLVDLRAAFDYGCALYSLSYHGRCHQAWTFYRESSAIDPYYYVQGANYTDFERQFWYAEEAARLFERVYRDCKVSALRQQALWMLAKCMQKRCGEEKPAYLSFSWMDKEALDYVRWNVEKNTWLATFHKECKGTPYYEEVFKECSYLRMFAQRH